MHRSFVDGEGKEHLLPEGWASGFPDPRPQARLNADILEAAKRLAAAMAAETRARAEADELENAAAHARAEHHKAQGQCNDSRAELVRIIAAGGPILCPASNVG